VKQPWLRPPWVFEREAALCAKLLVVVLLIASVGEIARRALPEWQLWVSLATAAAVAGGVLALFRRNRE
jgi:hypothetical protein